MDSTFIVLRLITHINIGAMLALLAWLISQIFVVGEL